MIDSYGEELHDDGPETEIAREPEYIISGVFEVRTAERKERILLYSGTSQS